VTDASFESFVHAHHASLFRTALLVTGNPDTAQDLVQTALARVYARWSRLRDEEPAAYARRIVVNAHRDVWRRNRGREKLVAVAPAPLVGVDVTGQVVDRDSVVRALRELTERERRVVVLRYLYDLSEAETAAELGMRVGTVKSTTHRAIGKLRGSADLAAAFTEETR
jgi:RNA polymerase sigma-70 factor (sigma-E family)